MMNDEWGWSLSDHPHSSFITHIMKPIKILQIFTVLNKGGAETNLMNYYRNMDKNEFQMDFSKPEAWLAFEDTIEFLKTHK